MQFMVALLEGPEGGHMAYDLIVPGEARDRREVRGRPRRLDRKNDPLLASIWSSHATCALRRRQDWEFTRRIALCDLVRGPRIADDFLSGIEDDCYAARSAAAGSSDWAFLASIPAISVKGFDIDVRVDESGISASFGGLNHDFPEISLALVWVRRALSRQYQLRIVCIGGLAREWYLEPVGRDQQTHQANGLNSSESLAAGHPVLMRRWRKTSVNYRRNHLLDLAGPGIVGH